MTRIVNNVHGTGNVTVEASLINVMHGVNINYCIMIN